MTPEILFLLCMIPGTFLLGYNDIQNKRCLSQGIDERLLVGIPFLLGGMILLLPLAILGFPELHTGFWKAFWITTGLNILSQSVWMRAFKCADASLIAPLRFTIPMMVVVTGFVFLGERPSVLGVVGIVVTLCGLWLLLSPLHAQSGKSLLHEKQGQGVKWGLLGAVLFALSFPFDKEAVLASSGLFFSGLAMLVVGSATLSFYAVVSREYRNEIVRIAPQWRSLLNIALVRAGGIFLTNQALQYSFVAYASSLKRLQSVWTVLLSGSLLKERNIGKKLVAVLIMVCGVALSVFWH